MYLTPFDMSIYLISNFSVVKTMKEVEVTEGGEKVEVQVFEEGDAVPLQDVSTESFLKEMGFDLTPMLDPPLGTLQNMYRKHLCPVHLEEMSQRSHEGGAWTYWRCPVVDCFVMTGTQDGNEYFSAVRSQLAAHYKEKWSEVRCFCKKPVVLCKSRSGKNPGRIYFRCKEKQQSRCRYFQWADEPPSYDQVDGIHSSRDRNGYPRRGYDCVPSYPPRPHPPTKGDNDKDLWDEVNATNFCLVDSTNEIVSPPELSGLHYSREKKEELLQLLYRLRSFKKHNLLFDPMELEFHKRATALGSTG